MPLLSLYDEDRLIWQGHVADPVAVEVDGNRITVTHPSEASPEAEPTPPPRATSRPTPTKDVPDEAMPPVAPPRRTSNPTPKK